MFAKSYGATTLGVEGVIIDVEVDVANGLPAFEMVGMPNALVREAKERVRTAIRNSGISLPTDKVTVNLAPADIRKDSAGLDLPIAIALLAANSYLPTELLRKYVFVSELSLEGECRKVNGILPMAIKAKKIGAEAIFVAAANANEAALVDGLTVYGVSSLEQVVEFLNSRLTIKAAVNQGKAEPKECVEDFCEVQGQFLAKRAFEIAAAGGHNLLLVGSPGAGKTMLARRMSSILPPMTQQEALEVTKIYSIAGLLKHNSGLMTERPFRSPHHTASAAALIGGGSMPKPGEVTLSHNGVLFLDELPEFAKHSLESLRQPLEDGVVSVARVNATLSYPSRIMLIAAMNPCPCGYYGDSERPCTCSYAAINRYNRKLSGPLLDRIDINVRVPRVSYQEITSEKRAEASADIRRRVVAARNIQVERFKGQAIVCNAQMKHGQLKQYCHISQAGQRLLEAAFQAKRLSARSYDRIVKVARTIADLAASELIEKEHIGEALQLRNDILPQHDRFQG